MLVEGRERDKTPSRKRFIKLAGTAKNIQNNLYQCNDKLVAYILELA